MSWTDHARRALVRVRRPARAARQGDAGALGRRARRRGRRVRRRAGGRPDGARRPAARALPRRAVVPYEDDDVTRLIIDTHDAAAFAPVAVADRRRLPGLAAVAAEADTTALSDLAPGLTPEMVAAVSKLMRVGDLVAVGRKTRVVTGLRTHDRPARAGWRRACSPTTRPTTPSASPRRWSTGCCTACGDAVVGINPATDRPLDGARAARADRRRAPALEVADPVVRAHPRDHHAGAARAGRAGRPRLPVGRRHPGRQPRASG